MKKEELKRKAWLFQDKVYWRRPSARFYSMFKYAVAVEIKILPTEKPIAIMPRGFIKKK